MSSLNRFALLTFAVLPLAFLAGCSSGPAKGLPPPTGGFGPSSLSGTYVFSTQGTDSTANADPLAMAGTFTANGSLGITGGTIDIVDPGFTAPFAGQAISGGSYTIGADGRGTVTLTTSTATPFGTTVVKLDFVLATPSQGLVTEFDAYGTGSGTFDLQSSATLSGSYAFNLSGDDLVATTALATVGSFTVGTDGSITGVQDFNDADVFTSYSLGGTVALGSGSAPGTATLTTDSFGTLSFDVYAVDSTHLKFIETSGTAFLSGDAFTQQGASLATTATTFAFTMGGEVGANVPSTATPLAVGGLMAIDGAGNITSGSEIDINDALTVTTDVPFSGTYAAGTGSPIPATGMGTVFTVSGISSVASQFVAYPTANAGLQMLESDGTGFLDGAALAQTSGAAISATQGYGMNLSGANYSTDTEEDDIAEFSTTSTSFSGLIDINDQGTTSSAQKYTGTYTVDSPATGRGEFATSNYNLGIFYAVDNSTLLFLDAGDGFLVGAGVLLEQNASGSSSAAAKHLIVPHHVLLPHSAKNLRRK